MQSGVAALSLTSAAARVTLSAHGRQPQVQAHVTAAERRRMSHQRNTTTNKYWVSKQIISNRYQIRIELD